MLNDQAERLRQIVEETKRELLHRDRSRFHMSDPTALTRTIAVTSGKGGVGKTNITVNLAIALAGYGKKVLVMDGDLGLANVDVVMGINPRYNLSHVISGEKNLKEIITEGPGGVMVLAGGSGIQELVNLSDWELLRFMLSMRELEGLFDLILIDTGAGLSNHVMRCVMAADDILVVTTPEPAAITDAYAMVKQILQKDKQANIAMVMNMVRNPGEATRMADRLTTVIRKFVGVPVNFIGFIAHDACVLSSIRHQKPFILNYPKAAASEELVKLAARLTDNEYRNAQVLPGGVARFIRRLTGLFSR